MRARRRQIIFDVLSPTTTLDTYGQAQRTYSVTLRIAGVYRTGSSSKAEYAEAQQGIQTNTIETRYVRGYAFTLDQLIKEVESGVEYRITGIEDVNNAHDTFSLEIEEIVL